MFWEKNKVGSPLIYGTTPEFLRLFGWDLIELPRLEDLASLLLNRFKISSQLERNKVSP